MTKRSSNRRLFGINGFLLAGLLAAASAGCEKKSPPPVPQTSPPSAKLPVKQPLPAVQANSSSAKKAISPMPVQKQHSSARLVPGAAAMDFSSKRDPFKPFLQAPVAQQPQKSASGKPVKASLMDALPIQRFDVEKFTVNGIITGLKQNSALIMAPDKKGYVVREGMLIGSNNGRVKRITTSSVEVEEVFKDDSGKVRKRLVKLTLIRKK